jgi:hypothetical protein
LVDLFDDAVEVSGGLEVVVPVPALVAIGPVEGPAPAGDLVAGPDDLHAKPLAGRAIREAVSDGDRVAADLDLEVHLVSQMQRNAAFAEPPDLGDGEVWHDHVRALGVAAIG